MLKHIREGIRLSGVDDFEYHRGSKHPYLVVNGRKITCSASPKNPDHTAWNLAKDIQRASHG